MDLQKKRYHTSIAVWSCITMFYCYQYVLRSIPNIISIDIMHQYKIGAVEFSSFASIYYAGYIIVHIPIGTMLSKFGVKKILPICIIFTAIGLLPLAYCNRCWTAVIIGRGLIGVGSSAAIIGALQIFRIIFPNKFSIMLGMMVSLGLLTVVYSGSPISRLIAIVGINVTAKILFYLGIVLAILTYFLIPYTNHMTSKSNSMIVSIKAIIQNSKILTASLLAGFMVGPLEGFADAWGSIFMITVYGIEKSLADSIILSIFLGMCFGSMILPYLAERTKMYFGTTIVSGVIMLLCFIFILNGSATVDILYYTCMFVGFFSAYQVVIITKITTFVSKEQSSIAAAIANMIIMACGLIFHKFIGIMLNWQWNGTIINGIKTYSSIAFVNSIYIIPMMITISIIGFTIIATTNFFTVKLIKK